MAGNYAGRFFAENVLRTVLLQSRAKKKFSARFFCSELRAAMQGYGWEPEKVPSKPPYWEFSALMTDGRRLVEISTNILPREIPLGRYGAIGVGWDKAIAATTTLRDLTLPEGEVARVALEVAIAHSLACGGKAWLFTVAPSNWTMRI